MKRLDPKTDGASADITAENIEALKALFPECVTEGKVDFEVLRELLGSEIEDRPERYSFNWHGKSRARRIAQTPSTGTLRPCPEESVNWDTTQNIFIEGDNLEVLKLLQKSYHKRVKMIYIDPPYNTGNEFIYPDKYQDNLETYLRYTGQKDQAGFRVTANAESSGRYHTNWLNMMLPRLKLARNLLRDDGLIFITIDDVEVANLRKICDEIFGEENFVANVVWQKAYVANMTAKYISNTHDHLVIYCRSESDAKLGRFPRSDEQIEKFTNPDGDPRGVWKAENLSSGKFYSAGQFPIITPAGIEFLPPQGRYWRCNEETYKLWENEQRIWFGKDGKARPMLKKYLNEVREGLTPDTWWRHENCGTNKEASIALKRLFDGKQTFDTPKPVRLLSRVISLADDPDGIFMDFFAGSCPLAEAILQNNRADGGQRRFLLVQLPERCPEESDAFRAGFDTISAIGKDRIRRVLDALIGQSQTHQLDLSTREGFRVFRLDASNLTGWDADFDNLEASLLDSIENIKPDRTEFDILYELLLKYGLDLAAPVEEREIADKTVYVVGAGALIVCLADGVTLEVAEGIAALKAELQPEITRVVFKDAGFPNDVVKTNTVQILRQAGIDDVKSL